MEIKQALTELRNEKKRKFVQSVDLIMNLKNFDVRREALNTFVFIPHGNEKKLAAFTTKRYDFIDTITEADFPKYNDLKNVKKLIKKYDAFIAIAPMMGKIATKFGRVFGPAGKMPSPQAGIIPKEEVEMIKSTMEKMKTAIRIRNKEMAIKFSVGKENMTDEQLEENISKAIKQLHQKLPRGIDNVKEVLIKFTMTKSIPIVEKK